MASQYLFLYPIKKYVDECTKFYLMERHKPTELNNLITARYRNMGYEINWLFFSTKRSPLEADLSEKSEYIEILASDRLIAAGLSRKEFEENSTYYPSTEHILSQLSSWPNKLVLGGFHQWDCVDKLARGAYDAGIDTFVDEDTTEVFLLKPAAQEVPLIRPEWNFKALNIVSRLGRTVAKGLRQDRPWFTQK